MSVGMCMSHCCSLGKVLFLILLASFCIFFTSKVPARQRIRMSVSEDRRQQTLAQELTLDTVK